MFAPILLEFFFIFVKFLSFFLLVQFLKDTEFELIIEVNCLLKFEHQLFSKGQFLFCQQFLITLKRSL